ncbi:MAG TPA: sigma-70 family RNA polymerase sigma factor [Vicinamibacterales bacterium]|nr:sigma-70 family RNA polymerase sigma factor [Vicinamibacterales bacterium]
MTSRGAVQPAIGAPSVADADRAAARAIRQLRAEGRHEAACDRFDEIVRRHQRRASRIAFHYLRDAAEADDAVQDAFVRAFAGFDSFREELSFEVWFTRILINGCLDRLKARKRRARWLGPLDAGPGPDGTTRPPMEPVATDPAPEARVLAQEQRRRLTAALARLPERQRAVFLLSQVEGYTAREVAELTGLSESTVRVHLFRAIRRLRALLADER